MKSESCREGARRVDAKEAGANLGLLQLAERDDAGNSSRTKTGVEECASVPELDSDGAEWLRKVESHTSAVRSELVPEGGSLNVD